MPGESQVKTFPSIHFGEAACSRAETMNEPGNAGKKIRLQNCKFGLMASPILSPILF